MAETSTPGSESGDLREEHYTLLCAVETVLMEHIGVLSGPFIDVDMAELARIYLDQKPLGGPSDIADALRGNS